MYRETDVSIFLYYVNYNKCKGTYYISVIENVIVPLYKTDVYSKAML